MHFFSLRQITCHKIRRDETLYEDLPRQGLQLMQAGRVNMLPQHLHIPQPTTVHVQWPTGTDPNYARREEEIANSNYLPPSQEHLRIQLAMHQAATEARRKEKSISTKVKKAFNWGNVSPQVFQAILSTFCFFSGKKPIQPPRDSPEFLFNPNLIFFPSGRKVMQRREEEITSLIVDT
jgi:hypothetical protein